MRTAPAVTPGPPRAVLAQEPAAPVGHHGAAELVQRLAREGAKEPRRRRALRLFGAGAVLKGLGL